MSDALLHLCVELLILAGGAYVLYAGKTRTRAGTKTADVSARFAGVLLIVAGCVYPAMNLPLKLPFELPW
jgi:hypothetical protein